MVARDPINSVTLQERFPEVYRDLFKHCPIVVSAPLQFLWTGEYAVLYGAPALTQHLPRRVWVGLETRNELDQQIYACWAYDDQSGQFLPQTVPGIEQSDLKDLLEKSLPVGQSQRLKIQILAETPLLTGAIFQGALAMAGATALQLFTRKITAQQLAQWPTQLTSLDSQTLPIELDQLIRLAWRWSAILGRYNTSGVHILPKFIVGRGPIVYRKTTKGDIDRHDMTQSYQARSRFSVVPFGLFLDGRPVELPLDIAIVAHPTAESTGTEVRATSTQRQASREMIKDLRRLDDQIGRPLMTQDLPKVDYYSTAVATLTWLAAKTCQIMIEIGRTGLDDDHVSELTRTINHYQQTLKLIGALPRLPEQIIATLQKDLGYFRGQAIGVKVIGSYGSGCYLIVGPLGSLRKINRLLVRVRRELRQPLWLYYASWRDGEEISGVRVEQSLTDRRFSRYIRQGAVQVRHLNLDSNLHRDLYTLDQFPRVRATDDLCLDGVEEEIFVRGQRLTSRDLHSSATTIELIKILIERSGQAVSNTELPDSSYTRDRNELQSKIVGPLVAAVRQRLGKRLPLQIHGSLTDFTIQLDAGVIDIDLVEQIF